MSGIALAVIAAVAGGLLIVLLFVALTVFFRKPKRQNTYRTVGDLPLSSIATSECYSFDPNQAPITMPELLRATRNFSSDLIVGDGSFGLVYKARLDNGATVAVKKLVSENFQGFREFLAETETLGKLRHPNIVTILGYCAVGNDRLLIYEFVEHGSLDQWLLDTSSSPSQKLPLNWDTRLKIVWGVARGLAYMHNLETPIIHRDIKAGNVLLDSEFEAHIADFGLARAIEGPRLHVSTQVAGTMGYMAPEYINGATMVTAMGDVYSFGVLMLEIATGIRPNLPFKTEEGGGKEVRLVDWAVTLAEQRRHMEMLDPNISREGLKEDEVAEFFRIAKICTSERPVDRPTMREVVGLLNQISS